jgi:hypothetical protein
METNVFTALTPNTQSLGDDNDYASFVEHLKKTLLTNQKTWGNALFYSQPKAKHSSALNEDVPVDFGQIFLASFSDERRQHYTCRCCVEFVNKYANIVFIDENGKARSAIWDAVTFDESNSFYSLVAMMQSIVESGKVTGSFKTEFRVLGQPISGGWNHMYVELPDNMLARMPYKTPRQQAAIVRADFEMLSARLAEPRYSLAVLTKLKTILDADVLQNQNVIKGPGTFLFNLASAREATKDQRVRNNLVWRAAATSAAGLMHSDVCDNVLDLLAGGADFDAIKKRFGKITQANTYRQAQSAPAEGAVDAAEKFFVDNGLVDSLRRRLAVPADIPEAVIVWKPTAAAKEEAPTSVFGHLKTPAKTAVSPDIDLPRVNMSWNKFAEEILPTALNLEIKIPSVEFFAGVTMAAVPESPSLFFYDHQASSYAKMGTDQFTGKPLPVPASNWNLVAGSFRDVGMIIPMPHQWGGQNFAHMKEQLLFVIPGAYDMPAVDFGQTGNALFAQLLKSEFHPYSSVVTAYANKAPFEGLTKDQVAGLSLTRGQQEQRLLRVTTESGSREILIDRWE